MTKIQSEIAPTLEEQYLFTPSVSAGRLYREVERLWRGLSTIGEGANRRGRNYDLDFAFTGGEIGVGSGQIPLEDFDVDEYFDEEAEPGSFVEFESENVSVRLMLEEREASFLGLSLNKYPIVRTEVEVDGEAPPALAGCISYYLNRWEESGVSDSFDSYDSEEEYHGIWTGV